MNNKFLLKCIVMCAVCLLTATSAAAQNCIGGVEVTAPAGGSVAAATSLNVYNSTEAGADSAAARTAVDAQDNAWRAAVTAANLGATFNFWNDTTTAQQNVSVPIATAFTLSGVGVGIDLRDFPTNYRTATAPCLGSVITTANERFGVFSKANTLQTAQNAPRPASLYNASNQPLVFDELEFDRQPNRNPSTVNAVVFTFSRTIKAFGTWIGDIETRTDGTGQPLIVRLLDAAGNRIGSDVRVEPMSGSQAACGGSAVGCGNQTTRWVGFTDTNATARVKQVIIITGVQDNTSGLSNQRIAFAGPTIPLGPTAATISVSGRALTFKNVGIAKVLISLTDSSGAIRTARTNRFGFYRFDDVPAGDTYIFNARVKGYQFSNNTQVLNISEDLQDVNFNAFPSRRDLFEPMF